MACQGQSWDLEVVRQVKGGEDFGVIPLDAWVQITSTAPAHQAWLCLLQCTAFLKQQAHTEQHWQCRIYYISRQGDEERIFTENNLKSPQVILQIPFNQISPFFPSELYFISSTWLPPGFPHWKPYFFTIIHAKWHPSIWETWVWVDLSPRSSGSASEDPSRSHSEHRNSSLQGTLMLAGRNINLSL